ncbi:MAG: EAL domain-containing protein [Ruminococcus sp.]|nr:EAL domain-containing protein [Ruminococcus sp.]
MRIQFSIIFAVLITALSLCTIIALRSHKSIGKFVAALDFSLIPPIIGNLLIISSTSRNIATLGCYIYFIGMDMVMFALILFTAEYCKGTGNGQKIPGFVHWLLFLDTLQILLNPFTGFTFTIETIKVEHADYFRFVPLMGQSIHRLIDYGLFISVMLLFFITAIKTPKIYREKYSIILVTMFIAGLWQTFYIFSRTPIDRSMIGFGLFGLLIFYFSLIYRPLRLLDRLLSNIASEMTDALFVFDPTQKCIWANDQGCALTEIRPGDVDSASAKLFELFGDPGKPENISAERMIHNGKEIRYYILEEHTVTVEHKKLAGTYLRVRDITEAKMRIKREMYEATHDHLTGLYTREHLYKRIAETLANNPTVEYYVVFVDVKDFKVVNDIFGVEFGDYALKCIAQWIHNDMSDRCCYGRLGGDTFGVLVPKEEFDPENISETLSRLLISYKNAEYKLLIHLGVYAIDSDDSDISVMFDRAHLALATIKDEYNTYIAYYDNEIRQQILWGQNISAQLYDAIRERQVCPYLQPIADSFGNIVGAEALARWNHPEHGFLSPASFIPIFEKNGMIVEIDRYMWRSACEILQKWQKIGCDKFISVNISPKDFYFTDVVAEIKGLASEYGVDPSKLRIEITETVMMNDADSRMQMLEDFRRNGFVVEMDDFGSGYSSLNMLKDMPVDVLKIDMKFLGRTKEKSKADTIVKNIINLSKELGILALTEGVENHIQFQSLSGMGCSLFQGFYFAKPMPVAEFETFAGINKISE